MFRNFTIIFRFFQCMMIISIEPMRIKILIVPYCLRVHLLREVEKLEDRKNFNFSPFCLVGSGKVEGWKKKNKFIEIYSYTLIKKWLLIKIKKWQTNKKKKKKNNNNNNNYYTYSPGNKFKKKKKGIGQKKFLHEATSFSHFSFLFIFGRKLFDGLEEKTPEPHHLFSFLPHPTKHTLKKFSFPFSF